jgi:hypothetical protein
VTEENQFKLPESQARRLLRTVVILFTSTILGTLMGLFFAHGTDFLFIVFLGSIGGLGAGTGLAILWYALTFPPPRPMHSSLRRRIGPDPKS